MSKFVLPNNYVVDTKNTGEVDITSPSGTLVYRAGPQPIATIQSSVTLLYTDSELFEILIKDRPGIFKLYEARMLQKEIEKIIEDNNEES